jgi:cyclase
LRNIRIIARLDIKGQNLIKGVHLEGLRVIGDPNEYALPYYHQGADELIFIDTVASLYGRNHLSDIIKLATNDIFIPITVGGGIRTLDDATDILRSGADKVAINTAAVSNPKIITEIAQKFGSQCVVISIEAKKIAKERWEVFTENGRERTGLDVISWVKQVFSRGAGEILITSIDKEGTRQGFDLELVKAVTDTVNIPVIASGGMGQPSDLLDVVREGGADGVAMADILHYRRARITDIRSLAKEAGLGVRSFDENFSHFN